jgi:DNA helicase-2/ATP-dependent DNA helicase PcrA
VNFLHDLNDAQREAAANVDGPMMVIAGAGSGKTRVLTYRIAHMMKQGVDPFSILALTFTNKAAREMKNRIGKLVGESEAKNLWMGTFHSVFARILRIECDRINYPRNFTIYDTQDSRSLLKDIIKGMGLDDKVYKPAGVQSRISSAKNNLIDARAYAEQAEIRSEDQQSGRPMLADIYAQYEIRCFRAGAMDFDDLLYKMNVLLRDFPDLLNKYQHRFRFILVDEYQDTNFAQYLIIKQLGAVHENVCVVGDDAQSIYAFRGANIQNILNFKKDYPEAKLFKLEQNYRSTSHIVKAANSVIANNRDQIPKEVWTSNAEGEKIKVFRATSDNDEGRFVANRIFEVRGHDQCQYKDFAILYRTNAQSRSFEESLRKLNVPYRIYGGLSFYQRKEVKDLLAYFRLTVNPNDDESFKRVVNYPARGIGKTSMDKLIAHAAGEEISLWQALHPEDGMPPAPLKGAAWKKLSDFVAMVAAFSAEANQANAHAVGLAIAKRSGLVHALYSDKTPEGVARYENVQELLNALQGFVENPLNEEAQSLSDFLIDVALLTDADNEDDDDNKVNLMTVHAAKGLEFKHVHIVGLEEQLFPSQMAMESRAELEEERRLFYVALTRAEVTCTLSYALTRFKWGQVMQGDPSRFLEEIDENCIVLPQNAPTSRGPVDFAQARSQFRQMPTASAPRSFGRLASKAAPKPPSSGKWSSLKEAAKNAPTPSASPLNPGIEPDSKPPTDGPSVITVGDTVMHAKFGKGKVVALEGSVPNEKATVFFPSVGQKQLLLKFAKLEVLG